MIAAARHFIYRCGGLRVPNDATHVSVHESVTVITANEFRTHPNIVELVCHVGVRKIEQRAFYSCQSLKRVIIPGVKVVEESAFGNCQALIYIECPKLERIGRDAFYACRSLGGINLQSVEIVKNSAFYDCEAMRDVKFGKSLKRINEWAFSHCPSLEAITLPLKFGLMSYDNTLQNCTELKQVHLVEQEVLTETIAGLLHLDWMIDMFAEMYSIYRLLPDTHAGGDRIVGSKTRVIRSWMKRILRKINRYKTKHRNLLNEAATLLGHSLPNDIVANNVLPFLELPSHKFDGEEIEEGGNNERGGR